MLITLLLLIGPHKKSSESISSTWENIFYSKKDIHQWHPIYCFVWQMRCSPFLPMNILKNALKMGHQIIQPFTGKFYLFAKRKANLC